MSKRSKKHGCRVISYKWTTALDFGDTLDALLEKAKAIGTVTEYDTGRGHEVWFNGHPGEALRALRREVVKKLSPYLPEVWR